MKTLLRLPVLVIGIVLFTFACKENEEALKPTQKSEIDFLEFDSRDAFDEAIKTNSINSSNKRFVSLKEAKSKSNLRTNADPLQIDNDFLQTVLNADGLIQIGDWIFKLDGSTRTVKALNKLNIDFLPQLKKGTVVENKIFTFTFEDDVLDLLENGITSSPQTNQRIQLFCGEKGVSANTKREYSGFFNYSNKSYQGGCQVDYFKGGVYFELRIHYGLTSGHPTYNTYGVKIPYTKDRQYWIEPKCRSVNSNHTIGAGTYELDNDFGGNPFWGDDEKIYASTRALHRLKVVQTYTWRDNNGAYLGDVTQTVNRGF